MSSLFTNCMEELKCHNCSELDTVKFEGSVLGIERLEGVFFIIDAGDRQDTISKEDIDVGIEDKRYFDTFRNKDEILERIVEKWENETCYDLGLICEECKSHVSHNC